MEMMMMIKFIKSLHGRIRVSGLRRESHSLCPQGFGVGCHCNPHPR